MLADPLDHRDAPLALGVGGVERLRERPGFELPMKRDPAHWVEPVVTLRKVGLPMLGAAGAVVAAMRVGGPAIELRPHRVPLMRTPEATMAALRGGLTERAVIEVGDALVAKFEGRAAGVRYETAELIRFSDGAVSFEHLLGPFRSCAETFELVDGGHALEHRGSFAMRGGLVGWLFGALVVRGIFERHVASHMHDVATAQTSA